MEIELDSNEYLSPISSSTCDSFPNQNNETQQKPINLNAMLNFLIEKYSLKDIMKRIIIFMTLRGKGNNINKDLDLMIDEIYQRTGSINIIKAMLEQKINMNKEDINTLSSASVKEKFIPIPNNHHNKNIRDNNSKNKSFKSNEDSMEVIHLEDDELKNDKNDNKNNNDGIIIDINDNYIDKEDKKEENNEIIDLKYDKLNSSNYIEINSNQGQDKKTSKKKRRFSPSQISYHCSLIEGIYYKYYKKIQYENKFFFICGNPECKGCGIYDINDKTFYLVKGHLVGNSFNCYKNLMDEQDKRNFKYMKNKNVNEIQMYNDENDEI